MLRAVTFVLFTASILFAQSASPSPAVAALIKQADDALRTGPFSVMEKKLTPPSGDKHDYMSVGPYWWPDPSKPNGLPYIRKDGQVNPERYAIKDDEFHVSLCT